MLSRLKKKRGIYVPSKPCLLSGVGIEPNELGQTQLAEVIEYAHGLVVRVTNTPRTEAMLHDGSFVIAPCPVDDRTG